ncbi:MAG: hypothetical protein HYZ73_02330 [Elusimicrobia bacterium]|nr:hypothetical protein [Elusimicrobiota bacterium]
MRDALRLSEPIATAFRSIDPSLVPSAKPYDGQFVYVITHDPFLRARCWIPLIGNPKYRYQRILYPLLAYALALGHPRWFPYTLLWLNVTTYVVGACIVGVWIRRYQWTSWIVIGYLVNTGLVYATLGTLTEPLAFALVLGGIAAWHPQNKWIGCLCFALSGLARETYLLIPWAVLGWEVIGHRRSMWQAILIGSLITAPFLLWWGYVTIQFPQGYAPSPVPWSQGIGFFTAPFLGIWQETRYGLTHLTTRKELIRTLSLTLMAVFLIGVSIGWYLRRRTFWGFLVFVHAVFLSVLRGDIWNYHAGSARALIPFLFFIMAWCADELSLVDGAGVDS